MVDAAEQGAPRNSAPGLRGVCGSQEAVGRMEVFRGTNGGLQAWLGWLEGGCLRTRLNARAWGAGVSLKETNCNTLASVLQ